MASRTRLGFLLGAALASGALFALGCKEQGSSGQESRPLPTPEPPVEATATPARDAAAPPKKRAPEDEKLDAKVKPALANSADKPSAPATLAAGSASAPGNVVAAPSAPPAATLAPTASAPVLAAPSAACLARCQGAMQGCLSAPVDGGVPGFGNLELCKKAFEACQSACAPK